MNAYLTRYRIAWLAIVATCTLLSAVSHPVKAADRENCLMCHRHRFIGRIDKNGKRWNYNVDEALYNRSLHRLIECRECHTNITRIPHDPITQTVNCANLCHVKPPFAQKKFSHAKIIALFNGSVHGIRPQDSEKVRRAKPGCKFCHLNPLYAKISEKRVIQTEALRRCYNCHLPSGVTQAYRHIAHRLRRKTSRSPGQIVRLCSKCHQDVALMKSLNVSGKALEAVKTYNRSIHGRLVGLGSQKAADCISCHASSALHDIYKKENQRATIYKGNLAITCGQCHKKTNSWFVRIAVHPGTRAEKNPLVHLASIILKSVVYGVIFCLLVLSLGEAHARRREGVKLRLRDGTSWRRKAKGKSAKQQAAGPPEKTRHRNPPFTSYVIGTALMLLTGVAFTDVVYHLTLSAHGPGLLRPLFGKHAQHSKSKILEKARRLEDLEQHRHFHNVAPALPRLPENIRPACFICHSDYPHAKNKKLRGIMNIHTQFLVCEACHLQEQPGARMVYKWYNPLDSHPKGPFYGTSYEPQTGYLAKGKDPLAKIAPYVQSKTGAVVLAVKVQNAPLARDYMQVRHQLSPVQREEIKNKFHAGIQPRGRDCRQCHSANSILDFKRLGFAENRISNLINLDVIGMLSKYKHFYIPDFFTQPQALHGDEMQKKGFLKRNKEPRGMR